MKVRRSIMLLLACLLVLGGCRTGQKNTALLEQELRLQEDRIYQLQDSLQGMQMALDAAKEENQSLRRSAIDEGGLPRDSRVPDAPTPFRPEPRGGVSEIPDMPVDLNIETPPESQFQDEVPEMLRGGRSPSRATPGMLDIQPGTEAPAAMPGSEEIPRPLPGESDRQQRQNDRVSDATSRSENAARIEIGDLAIERTNGRRSAAAGDGISLFVAPRDERGEPLPAPAAISVVVVDPAISGEASRVARWDFTPEETATLRQQSVAGDGFRLGLQWPKPGPAHKELHLFVRYTTADGRNLETRMPLDLGRLAVAGTRPAPQPVASWQRKISPLPREQRGTATPTRATLDRPRSGSPTGETSPRVASQPRRPVWSPERK
ncbi:MAG: hypothetical protein JW888_16590 [Pirellulales bacterium]|nr:hypothetical protein [Pirellulales bacterium]